MATKPRGRPAFVFGTADFLVRHMNLRGPLPTALADALKGYTVFSVFLFIFHYKVGLRDENILD